MRNVSFYVKHLPKSGMKLLEGIAPVLQGCCGFKLRRGKKIQKGEKD